MQEATCQASEQEWNVRLLLAFVDFRALQCPDCQVGIGRANIDSARARKDGCLEGSARGTHSRLDTLDFLVEYFFQARADRIIGPAERAASDGNEFGSAGWSARESDQCAHQDSVCEFEVVHRYLHRWCSAAVFPSFDPVTPTFVPAELEL